MFRFRRIGQILHDNFFAEQSRWFASVPFLFALGIAIYFGLPFEPNMWVVLGVFELWLLLFYLLRHRGLHLLFMAGIIILFGFINIMLQTQRQARRVEALPTNEITYLRGQITDIAPSSKGKPRLLLNHAADYDVPLKGKFRISLTGAETDLQIQQCVEMIATLFPRQPLPVLNGYQTDLKYFYEGLSATGYADSEVFAIKCPPEAQKPKLQTRINAVRQRIIRQIAAVLPASSAGVVDALTVGSKAYLTPQIMDHYRDSGLAHFLSVSGLHMGTIAALIFFVLRFLLALFPAVALRFDVKKIAAVGAIIGSGGYLLISGMAIPAWRAFIMTTVVLCGVIFNRQAISLRMVSFAAAVILILAPQALVSASFQMSFAAVYALVAFYEVYAPKLAAKQRAKGFVSVVFWYWAGIVICDLVASLATAPFALYHFHRLALYTSLGNLLAAPIIAFWTMPMVLLCLATLPFGLAQYPLQLLGGSVEIINKITGFVPSLPHSVWQNSSLTFWGLMAIVCGAYWLCIWRGKWRRWGILPIVCGVLSLFWPPKQPDMVFAPDAAQVAVRDYNGELVMLPLKKDAWLQSLWQENLHIQLPDEALKKELAAALRGEGKMPENLPLQCDAQQCVYRDRVIFYPQNVLIDGIKIDTSAGGYIYFDKEVSWQPLWQNHGRLWQQKIERR
ncbi:MAG: ComEC/Rec2 family competence protein [Alphaproteobacteria bacterium]|nr:ComEC/Rec2 family competence protein [Alphaproteobacteria bacterium]